MNRMKHWFGAAMQATSQLITNVIQNQGEKFKDRSVVKASKEKTQQRKYKNATDYEKMSYHPEFPTKDRTGLEVPSPLALHYLHDLNLWLGISCSFDRLCADHWRAFSSHYWVRRTRLTSDSHSLVT